MGTGGGGWEQGPVSTGKGDRPGSPWGAVSFSVLGEPESVFLPPTVLIYPPCEANLSPLAGVPFYASSTWVGVSWEYAWAGVSVEYACLSWRILGIRLGWRSWIIRLG